MVFRNAASLASGNAVTRIVLTQVMTIGIAAVQAALQHMFKLKGFSMDRAKKQTLGERRIEKMLERAIA
jgi:hypothetical protein